MRLNCPLCGLRDVREFTYRGSSKLMARPDPADGLAAFHDYVHLRENRAGENEELWHHHMGCSSWLLVVRHVSTHQVIAVNLAHEATR